MLLLAEQLLLLALDDERGKLNLAAYSTIDYGLVGALLIELALRERINIGAQKHLAVLDATPTGDELLDQALALITESTKTRNIQSWVTKLHSSLKQLRDRLLERMVGAGILRHEEGKLLLLIPTQRYPTQDTAPEHDLRTQLQAVLVYGAAPDPSIAALAVLIDTMSMTNMLFAPVDRKKVKARIKALGAEQQAGSAISSAIMQITNDIAAATTAVMIATSCGYGGESC